MKVRLYQDTEGVGKRGETVDVEGAIGEALNARGECEVIQHDPPKAPGMTLKKLDKATQKKLEERDGNA